MGLIFSVGLFSVIKLLNRQLDSIYRSTPVVASSSLNYMRRIRSKNYTELEVLTRNFCSDLNKSRMRQMAG